MRAASIKSVIIISALGLLASVAGCSNNCSEVETDIGDICLPSAVTANLQSELDVREACGSDCAQAPSCTAVLLSGALYLTLREDQCSTTVASCIATPCNHNVVPCAVPGLGPGDYPVIVSGGPGAVLHVRDSGTSACHLPVVPVADGGS